MRTRAPSVFSTLMLERATRMCRMSPQMATVRPGDAALGAADGQRVEQRLRRMLVRAVAGVDHRAVDLLRQQLDRARRVMAHDDDVGPHGVERHRGVDQRLALLHRGGGDVHVHDVGAEPLGRHLERALRARRGFEEQIDQRAPAQDVALLAGVAVVVGGLVGEVEKKIDLGAPSPSTVRRWRCGKWSASTLATALVIKGVSIGRVSALGQAALGAAARLQLGNSLRLITRQAAQKAINRRRWPARFATHEVFNQPPPFEDVNLFASDAALIEAVEREGGGEAAERARSLRAR